MARETKLDHVRVVLKFSVAIDGKWHGLLLPPGATIIHVGNTMLDKNLAYVSGGELALHFWAETPDPRDEPVRRQFRAYATGEPITDPTATWAGTFIEDGFVWHLYMKLDVTG